MDRSTWEVELVVVIGAGGRCIAVGDAWSHVAGLTAGQDISERVLQRTGPAPQFSLAKSYPGFSPMGPWLVTPDELPNPDDVELKCAIDGEFVQKSRPCPEVTPLGRGNLQLTRCHDFSYVS